MKISIDYDETFTADPDFWREVIRYGRKRGHEFICVTARSTPPGMDEPAIPCEVICSPLQYKVISAMEKGHNVDVWIDDCPGMIMKSYNPLENEWVQGD